MMISENSIRTKTTTAATWVAVEDFPGDQIVQRAQVGAARKPDQHSEPEPGFSQHPLRPAVLLPACSGCPPPAETGAFGAEGHHVKALKAAISDAQQKMAADGT